MRYEEEIYRFVYRMTNDRQDAADIFQETFMRALRAFGRLPKKANHRAWLYRIAGNTALNLARSKKVRKTVPIDEASTIADPRDGPEDVAETRRLARMLAEALKTLSPRQRTALVQRKYGGLSYREIASVMGCSEQTARAHVYQGMKRIRRLLDRIGRS
jgi:RNA polymerase sigma factor (sigma-70 family)